MLQTVNGTFSALSSSGNYIKAGNNKIAFQSDGNLVGYDTSNISYFNTDPKSAAFSGLLTVGGNLSVVKDSTINGHLNAGLTTITAGPMKYMYQPDGNFVSYDSNNVAQFASGGTNGILLTNGIGGGNNSIMHFQGDSNTCIRNSKSGRTWCAMVQD